VETLGRTLETLLIMLTVPLSIPAALLALWWSGGTLNIYSQVGIVTLFGSSPSMAF
jgi:multidrug efflux pump